MPNTNINSQSKMAIRWAFWLDWPWGIGLGGLSPRRLRSLCQEATDMTDVLPVESSEYANAAELVTHQSLPSISTYPYEYSSQT